ncbi:hypothetical protein MPSEU_000875700 [Mayamaea pseudoterrestris]|nr:hypothetical protein MPSEU_000875700 [Mayamaea pseudoterrestris]
MARLLWKFIAGAFALTSLVPSLAEAFVVVIASTKARPRFPDSQSSVSLNAAPKGALGDIVIPGLFSLQDQDASVVDDPRVWVPQTDCLSFRPLCFCVSQGYYVNLLKFKGGGVLGRHRHVSPVHALTLQGNWSYKEHSWHASPGTYVFEPPGETHTLMVDDNCEEMIAMFHVTGALLYIDEESDQVTGYDDVFTKLEKARTWYKECGLNEDYAEQFIR